MKIKEQKQSKFCVNNIKKRTPIFWRKIGNTIMYIGLPTVTSAVMGSPLNSDAKLWVNFGVTVAFLIAKGLTKFFAEDE